MKPENLCDHLMRSFISINPLVGSFLIRAQLYNEITDKEMADFRMFSRQLEAVCDVVRLAPSLVFVYEVAPVGDQLKVIERVGNFAGIPFSELSRVVNFPYDLEISWSRKHDLITTIAEESATDFCRTIEKKAYESWRDLVELSRELKRKASAPK